jgi:hypothetical protein
MTAENMRPSISRVADYVKNELVVDGVEVAHWDFDSITLRLPYKLQDIPGIMNELIALVGGEIAFENTDHGGILVVTPDAVPPSTAAGSGRADGGEMPADDNVAAASGGGGGARRGACGAVAAVCVTLAALGAAAVLLFMPVPAWPYAGNGSGPGSAGA